MSGNRLKLRSMLLQFCYEYKTSDGKVERFKGRYVAKSFRQIDYNEMFLPVVRFQSI